jgi:hypothetical protein
MVDNKQPSLFMFIKIKRIFASMNNSEKDFSPQESLQLIRSMIETTKHSISDNSHFFLLWGWATMIGCITQYVLLDVVHYQKHFYAWFITPLAVLIHLVLLRRYKRGERVKTFISEANEYIWTVIGLSYMALAFVFLKIGWQYCFPFYILLYGIGTFITGSLIKFKPMKAGGIICIFLVAVTPYLSYPMQILLAAFAILVSYIIPGHLLKNQYKKDNQFR